MRGTNCPSIDAPSAFAPPPTRQRADSRVAAVERAAVGMAEEIVVSPEVQAELES